MIFEISLDDGHVDDLYAVELLEEYGLNKYTTLYIPTIQTKLSKDQIKALSKKVKIGGHTATHPMDLKKLNHEGLLQEIFDAKKDLEELIKKPVTSFCYPRGRYNDTVVDMVRHSGFTEGRTTAVLSTQIPKDPFRKDTTIHMFARKEYEGRDWLELAKEKFQKAFNDDTYFHVWGHSWELSENKEWRKFEDLLLYLKDYIC